MEKITILIAEDHTLIRETWNFILNSDPRFQVLAACGNGEEAVELARQLRPNVVTMDINLPGINGFEAAQLIRKYSPGSKILGVSMHSQPAYARKMIQAGAKGYVTKNSSYDELMNAISEIHNNRTYVCQDIKDILAQQSFEGKEQGLNSLSSREIEIIGYIKKGYSSKQIAEPLNISMKTIEVHRYNILKKLNLKNTAALVNYINNTELGFGS
jgi:two-component system invasion response regulator UvrY